jgi:hypothetical protein
VYKPDEMLAAGLAYHSIGRPPYGENGEPVNEQLVGLRAIA